MPILAQPLHTFKSDEYTFVGAAIEGESLVIANTRNEEHAQEGQFLNLVTVIPLADAIAIAKAVLATQEADEDAAYDAWIDAQYIRWLDHQSLVDDALAHDVAF